MEWKVSYIYKVTNTVNGKIYIGQSVTPIDRLRTYTKTKGKKNYLLHYAIQKYGVENFLFEIIRSEVPIDKINETEMQLIKEHGSKVPNGYNITDGGEGHKGGNHSDETKKKISLANKGRKHSEEARNKMSLASRNRIRPPKENNEKKKISRYIIMKTIKKMHKAHRKKRKLIEKQKLLQYKEAFRNYKMNKKNENHTR